MTPLPMYVGLTGTWRYSASSTSSSEASAMIVPPPGISTGFSASRIISMACRMALGLGGGPLEVERPAASGIEVHLSAAVLHIERQIYEDRTGPPLAGDAERLPEGPNELGRLLDLHRPLRNRLRNLHDVYSLEGFLVEHVRRGLSRNADHGYGVGLAGVEPRDHVRSRRPAGPDIHPDLARYPRVTVCGVRPALFVPHGVVRYALGSAQSLVQRQHGRPRDPEDDIHAFVLHYPNDRVHNVHHRHR